MLEKKFIAAIDEKMVESDARRNALEDAGSVDKDGIDLEVSFCDLLMLCKVAVNLGIKDSKKLAEHHNTWRNHFEGCKYVNESYPYAMEDSVKLAIAAMIELKSIGYIEQV